MTTNRDPKPPAYRRVYLYYRGQGFSPEDSRLYVAAFLEIAYLKGTS